MLSRSGVALALLFMALVHCNAVAAPVPHASGVVIPLDDTDASITVEVASSSAFRLGVRFGGSFGGDAAALPSLSLNPTPPAPFNVISIGDMKGVNTSFGALLASPSGAWEMLDAAGQVVVSNGSAPVALQSWSGETGISVSVSSPRGSAVGPAQPCLGNGMFGPPFYWARQAGFFSFAVSEWNYDPAHPHCYPVKFDGNASDLAAPQDLCAAGDRQQGRDVSGSQRTKEHPNGASVASADACCALCEQDSDCNGWVYGTDLPGQTNCWPLAGWSGTVSSGDRVFGGPPPTQSWWSLGSNAADWYLSPTLGGAADFQQAYYQLTGAVALPPRYALGFMACYWGYDTTTDITTNMTAFREGNYPVDSFIEDYDWWKGTEADMDFGYNPRMFCEQPTCTFKNASGDPIEVSTPKGLLQYMSQDLHMRWGGIRKPRTYSNVALSNSSGWLLPPAFQVGAGGNNWNFTKPDFRAWYVKNHLHFLQDGVSYWWNDEGETEWFTYSWWNEAQRQQYQTALPNQRHFTLNRAFQPGMQTYPAVTWTGDRQDCSHLTTLGFIKNGQPWVACDMTAPDASVLVRQYQNAVFLPIMRVHAMHGHVRFPFHWPQEAADAMRLALELRYQFIPHLSSLAHASISTFIPMARPASWVYSDAEFPFETADNVYMVGDTLIPADVCTSNSPSPQENSTSAVLPPGTWFEFNSTVTHDGNQTITRTDVPLSDFVLYVRAGAVLTLQDGVVQYTDKLGGSLVVHVYHGADGDFTLYEDDGATLEYQSNPAAAVKTTRFTWHDASKTLEWDSTGSFSGPNSYTSVTALLFVAGADGAQSSASHPLSATGSIAFSSA